MFDEWRATAPERDAEATEVVTVPGRPAAMAGADVVDYGTTVEDPRTAEEEVAVLELHGLYASASVEVPGERLHGEGPVSHDTYFRPLRIPFFPEDGGELTVRCRGPEGRFGGIHDTDLVPETDAVPGIWWDASLEGRQLPYIESVDIRPTVSEESAHLSLRTTVVSDQPLDENITYSLRPAGDLKAGGTMERGSVETAEAGRTVVEHSMRVRDPSLWWPRSMGEQNMYTLRAKLDGDETTITTGLCDVQREGGALRVNGEAMHIRGVNLLTDDPEDVDRALECNANLLRAHAQALPEAVYERANEEGLLVWQDLPLTGPGTFDVERGKAVAAAVGNQYGRHPSLAAVGVHDDPVDAFEDGLGSGFLDQLRLRYRAWRTAYDDGPARTVGDAVPLDAPVFPVVGGPGVGAAVGSYYPGWQYGDANLIDELLDRYPVDLLGEFGAGALGEESGADASTAGFDAAIHRDRVAGDAGDSQAYQASVLETVAGALRTRRLGAIAFALRDTDRAGMGVFTAEGEPKSGADALADAFQPVRAYLSDPDGEESNIVVLNDRPRALSTELSYEVGDERGEMELTVNSQGRWSGGPIPLPEGAETAQITVVVDEEPARFEIDLQG